MSVLTLLGRLIRWLFWGLVFLFLFRWIRRVLNPPRARGRRPGTPPENLVQDPECGAFLPPSIAVQARGPGGTVVYFCSEACARAYIGKRQLRANSRSASL